MGSFDSLPSLVTDMRNMRSQVAEMQRQRLGVARKQSLASTRPTTPVTALPTGLADAPQMSATLDPEGFPVICFFSAGLVGNHFVDGWKQVTCVLVVEKDGVETQIVESQRTIFILKDADTKATSFVVALNDPGRGATTFKVKWGVTGDSGVNGITGQPNPTNDSHSGYLSRSFAALRIGALA